MNFLLLSLLAIQAGSAAAAGLSLWPQVAAAPPGSNTTVVTETVTPPTPQTASPNPSSRQPGTAAPGSVILLPSGALPQSSAPNSGARSPAQPGIPGVPAPGAPPQATAAGASSSTAGAGGSMLPAGGIDSVETGLPRPAKADTEAAAATARPSSIAAAPSRIVIGIRQGKRPRSKRVTLWTDNKADVLTVRPQQDWIKVVAGRAKKGAHVYTIAIDTLALPPGRLHDGVIRVGSSTGSLDLPVTVELHTAN